MENLIYSFSQAQPDGSGAVKVSLYNNRVVLERNACDGERERSVVFLKNLQSISLVYPVAERNTRFHLEFNCREGASFWNEGDVREKLEKLVSLVEEMM